MGEYVVVFVVWFVFFEEDVELVFDDWFCFGFVGGLEEVLVVCVYVYVYLVGFCVECVGVVVGGVECDGVEWYFVGVVFVDWVNLDFVECVDEYWIDGYVVGEKVCVEVWYVDVVYWYFDFCDGVRKCYVGDLLVLCWIWEVFVGYVVFVVGLW